MPVCWMNEWMQVFREYLTHNIYTDTCYAMLSHFSRIQLGVTPETADHQAPCPWDSPGKNTGVGCYFPSPVHESEKWKWSRSVVSDS